MKTILRVAKTELRTLFYSPIAWFLLIVFFVQCSIAYVGSIEMFARMQAMRGVMNSAPLPLTSYVFLGKRALFPGVMQSLYLYIPLLTMSLISRETSSGTIKLLYSSPIRVREIIFGKFLSMMIYSLLLVGIVSVFVIAGLYHIPHLDLGMLLTGLLGFYLLLCAYAAIGLFMSCLTTYQVVAALCTFVMIGILSYIGTLWQSITFVRELTYFLSISGRTENMLNGLLSTKDVIYFLVIVYIFLGLSIYRLKSGMESKPAIVKAGRYTIIVASALLIGYVSSFPGMIGYYDATANKSNTLTPKVQKILTDLGSEPLEITSYANLLDNYFFLGSPASYNLTIARWAPYTRFKRNIELKTVYYYDSSYTSKFIWNSYPGKNMQELAAQSAKNGDLDLKDFKTPAQIRQLIDLRPEQNRFVMQLKWKDKTTFLRVYDDQSIVPSETEVAAALKRLQQAKLPKIAFLTGDLERSIDKKGDRNYSVLTHLATFRNSLVNQGFDVDTVSLETQDVPADITTLVIADPKVALRPATLAKLQQYISNGGNMLIAGEPGKQDLLNPLLQPMGVQMMNGMLVQESKAEDLTPDQVTPNLTPITATLTKPLAKSEADSVPVFMTGVAGLSIAANSTFQIQPLLMSDPKLTWNRVKPLNTDMALRADASDAGTVPVSVAQSSNTNTPPARPGNIDAARAAAMKAAMASAAKATARPAPAVKMTGKSSIAAPVATDMLDDASDGTALQNRAAAATVSFSAADGDVKGPIATLVSLTRKINGKEQRIVVSGDADFLSNSVIRRPQMANFILGNALFSWLSYGEFPIDASRPDPADTRVSVSQDNIGMLRILYIWVLPGILLAFGSILLIRRKRK